MSVRSRRLASTSVATAGSGATTVAYTVPADRTAIIKRAKVWLAATSVGAIWLPVYIQTAAGGVHFIGEWYASTAPHAMIRRNPDLTSFPDQDLWEVLHEGDSLRLAQPAGCTISTYWSGTLLLGDPA